jgi:hypothetical protein
MIDIIFYYNLIKVEKSVTLMWVLNKCGVNRQNKKESKKGNEKTDIHGL